MACLQIDPDLSSSVTICVQDVGDNSPDVFNQIQAKLKDLGANLKHGPSHKLGEDLWQSTSILSLKEIDARPFVCMDPGTVVFRPQQFENVTRFASRSFAAGWPVEHLYGAGRRDIWAALAELAEVDLDQLVNATEHPAAAKHWPAFDGALICGDDAQSFGETFYVLAKQILQNPPEVLATQEYRKALRQIILPLVFAKLGGQQSECGPVESHFNGCFPSSRLAYLYTAAPEPVLDHLEASVSPNPIKKLLKNYEPAKKLIYQQKGRELRDRFYDPNGQDPNRLIKRLKRQTKWWVR